jgi:signal transduction histidine kinase
VSSGRLIATGVAGLAAAVGVAVLALESNREDPRVVWAVTGAVVGLEFVFTGLYASRRRPESRIGALMVLLGFAWFASRLSLADDDAVHTVGEVAGGLFGGLFMHLGLTFPTGRARTRGDAMLIAVGYVVFLLVNAPVPVAPLLVALFLVVFARACRIWLDTDAFERLQLTPVYAFSLLTFLLITLDSAGVDGAWWAAVGSTALMPFAYLGGLLRSHVVRLDEQLRDRLEELRASRARLVQAGDAERRRLERDLHDGAQSRLVGVSMLLRHARRRAQDGSELANLLDRASDELTQGLTELRELAHGIHPAVLTDHGLEPAVESLVSRAPVPVRVDVPAEERLPPPVESAAYFVVSEALTNVAKYAQATSASVEVRRAAEKVTVVVTDDGVGGADASRGSGLRGLADRVAALDGTLSLESPPGRGTRLRADIPID